MRAQRPTGGLSHSWASSPNGKQKLTQFSLLYILLPPSIPLAVVLACIASMPATRNGVSAVLET